jgi:hypothetical protein
VLGGAPVVDVPGVVEVAGKVEVLGLLKPNPFVVPVWVGFAAAVPLPCVFAPVPVPIPARVVSFEAS